MFIFKVYWSTVMWSLSLTKAHNEALEKVQKVSLTVIELYVD